MRKRAMLTVLATTGAAVFATAGAAHADVPDTLYVQNSTGTPCSDTGPGSSDHPYCTIAAGVAAVTAGQTLSITGNYAEHVTIGKSGEPGRPITLKSNGNGTARLWGGPGVGFSIDGRHDIAIRGIGVLEAASGPGIAVQNSARITLENTSVQPATAATITAVQLTGVTDSAVLGLQTSGLALGAGTSGVTVRNSSIAVSKAPGGHGIDILGSGNTITGSRVSGGIAVGPGAAGNVIANNYLSAAWNAGIDNSGATGTAISNNEIHGSCAAGVRVSGAATGVSVQNNVISGNGNLTNPDCTSGRGVEISAVSGAVVDYNNASRGTAAGAPDVYSWNGTTMGLAAFRAASGQGVHDTDDPAATTEDAANSAAPGWPERDMNDWIRENDPDRADTGAGPVAYADRGWKEAVKPPSPAVAVKVDQVAATITADASGSVAGWLPIGSYTFDFGDGTAPVTQASPIATHHYANPATYDVRVTAKDANFGSTTNDLWISLFPAVRTIALLTNDNFRFVTGGVEPQPLRASGTAVGPGELFDVVAGTGGHVALRSRQSGKYVRVSTTALTADSYADELPDGTALFDLTTNADGTISLRSVFTGGYVSSNGGAALIADRTAVGPWEKFGVVNAADAGVTLKAHANTKFVTADNGGNSPLIANRTTTGQWETFDLVDAGGGWVALYSHANGKFVTADNGGNSPLIANRTTVGAWEKFKIIKNADGSTGLQANANGKYVTADNGGNSPLIANRTAIGAWEEFDRA
ncbi:right-handed parallel beta-helix repeat-containing protein [Dactylosporangium sp. CS-047395]|uniref:right-handed parallel beta-helix repeat-containing protein n=1 Tax=Dactylosporangium sp. CS-047395 TaxID=3239936 RepID=UPI003D90D619